jgi:hypothetical protein
VSPAVAIVEIISGRAVELAGIVVLGWVIHSAIPQFRMSAPKDKADGNGDKDGAKQ